MVPLLEVKVPLLSQSPATVVDALPLPMNVPPVSMERFPLTSSAGSLVSKVTVVPFPIITLLFTTMPKPTAVYVGEPPCALRSRL